MSRFSGKCDFYDYLDEKRINNIIEGTLKVYAAGHIVPLHITSEKDLVPYYPYLVTMAGYYNNQGRIHLSSSSFVDEEEQERLNWKLKYTLRYYNRCKRNHVPYNTEEAALHTGGYFVSDIDYSIADRVAEYGKKANTEGLHLSMHQYYRKELYEEMIANGWPETTAWYWVYKEYKSFDSLHDKLNGGSNE